MKPVAILGGGGFVGSRLVEHAILTGRLVVPVVRSPKSIARLSKLGAECRLANTGRLESLTEALRGHDVVVNLASGDWTSIAGDAELAYRASAAAGVKLHMHMSSAVVFGRVESDAIHDDSPPDLGNWMLYAREKGKAENFLRSCLGREGPRVVVLRPGLIWGPRSPWSLLPARAFETGTAWLSGAGEGICNLLHVDNLARYIWRVIASDSEAKGFYNVADPETVTWKRLYVGIARGLQFDLGRIRMTDVKPRRLSASGALDLLRNQASSYRVLKGLLKVLSGENKSRLKAFLPALAGGRYQPPCPQDVQPEPSEPRISQEQWALQNTVHRLPTEKFVRDFGDPGLQTFDAGLESTVAWLRFAGYGPSTFTS